MNPATTSMYKGTLLAAAGVRAFIPHLGPLHAGLAFKGAARFEHRLFTIGRLHGMFAFASGSS